MTEPQIDFPGDWQPDTWIAIERAVYAARDRGVTTTIVVGGITIAKIVPAHRQG